MVDRQVENALLKRALGYEYTEVTKEYVPDVGKMTVTKEVTKQVIPDTTAQIFWLKNRKPGDWRDKPTDLSLEDEKTSVEDWKAAIIEIARKREEQNE